MLNPWQRGASDTDEKKANKFCSTIAREKADVSVQSYSIEMLRGVEAHCSVAAGAAEPCATLARGKTAIKQVLEADVRQSVRFYICMSNRLWCSFSQMRE